MTQKLSFLTYFVLLLFVSPLAAQQNEIPPGAYTNDKLRLLSSTVAEGSVPIIFEGTFSVRDSDGLSRQQNTGDLFYIRWTVQILKANSVVKTITKDEPIVPPFTWVQLPKQQGEGTEPFVQIISALSWDGKNEQGQTVPGPTFAYQLSGTFIRVIPRIQQTQIIGAVASTAGQFAADGEKPVITVTPDVESRQWNQDLRITVTFSDNSGSVPEQKILLDNHEVTSPIDVTSESPDPHKLEILARDAAGNTATLTLSFVIDKTAPVINAAIPACGQGPVSLDFSANDTHLDSVTALLNNAAVAPGTILNAAGTYILIISAQDEAGNQANQTLQFAIDQTPPSIQVTGIENEYNRSAVIPVVQITDPNAGSSAVITLDGNPFASGTPVISEGVHKLKVIANDCALNQAVAEFQFTIDDTPPKVTIQSPASMSVVKNATSAFTVQEPSPYTVSCELNDQPIPCDQAIQIADGSHSLKVIATDAAGNAGSANVTFSTDTVPPVLNLANLPADGYITNQNITIDIHVEDANPDQLTIHVDENVVPNGSIFQTEGRHVLTAQATDKAGNQSEIATRTFDIDKTKPLISVDIQDHAFYKNAVTPLIEVVDQNKGTSTFTLDGMPYTDGTSIAVEGEHTLVARHTDLAGNEAEAVSVEFTIDSTAPAITIQFPKEGEYYGTDITPRFEIVEANVKTKTIFLNDVPYTEGTPISTEALHLLKVEIEDRAGNIESRKVQFTIDKTPPVISIIGVERDRFYASHPTLNVTITEANPETSSTLLDSQAFVSGSTVTQEGRHELIVTARDKANHSSQQMVEFGVDTVPPVIHIQSPKDSALYNFDAIQVSGTLEEEFIKEVTINGSRSIASSDLFVANNVHLNEGSNTITVVATDLAGSTAQVSVTVRLDQTPPSINITSPANGSQVTTGIVSVNGTFSAADIQSINVNGIPSTITANTFVAGNLRLSEGVNTIRAIARDSAGNTQEASVQVTLDTEGPRVAITKPVDGSFTTVSTAEVAGFIFDVTAPAVTVNGTPVTLQGDGSFSTTISLAEGTNLISVAASDVLGNQATGNVSVVKDSQNPSIISISPANGSIGVPPVQQIEIRFSEEVKKSTITNTAIKLIHGTNFVNGTLQQSGNRVTLIPQHPLSGATTYTLTVSTSVTDLIGNPLHSGASASFTTLDDLSPAPPTIEPELPAITSHGSIIVAGVAEANSNVEITGGAVRVNTISSDTGNYSVEVALFEDAVNQLSITATDVSGNTSTPATATVVQDSVRMVVVDASFELDGSIVIDFSKPVNVASITPQNIFVVTSNTISGTVVGAADPARIIFYPQIALNNPAIPFVLKVEPTVQDQGGHSLEYPFSKLFNGISGNSFVQGEVWDNASGQPLAGAVITQVSPAVVPAPVATSDLRGQFVLPVSSGDVRLRIDRQQCSAGASPASSACADQYLPVYRSVSVPSGSAVVMLDARLEPVSMSIFILTTSQKNFLNPDGSAALIAPAGSVVEDTTVVVSKRDGQSLPSLLPDGWAPVAAGTIQSGGPFQQDVTLRIKNESGMGAFSSMPTAYYDEATSVWRTGPSGFVSSDGQFFEVQTNKATTHAFLMFDPSNPPPPSLPDQPLQPSPSGVPVPTGLPNLIATPTGIYPQQRALVATTFSGSSFRSGSRFQAILKENFTLLSGLGSVQTTPMTADLIGYSMGQPSNGEIKFYASPSKAIDFTKLDVGFIDVEIHAFPHSTDQPGVIDTSGGTVSSADGSLKLEVPAGALNRAVPVTVIPLRTQDLTLVIPGYTMVSAFEVNLAGATFSTGAVAEHNASVSPSGQFVLARLAQVGSRSLWVVEGTATYDGVRLRTVAGPATLRGIMLSGVYGIFAAQDPISYLTGSITNPQSVAAGPNILVTSDQNPLAALSNSFSTYTLAVPSGSGNATAANQVTGDQGSSTYTVPGGVSTLNLQIHTTPPRILSITPEANVMNVNANSTVRVTFSEAILASSLNASTFYLLSNNIHVAGRILLTSNNTIGIFTPSTSLLSNAEYTIVITNSIKDLVGNNLENPPSTHRFRVADTTAPQPASLARFKLFLPENGTVRFEVPEIDIEPGTSVIFFNDTKRTSISSVVNPCTAGASPASSCFTATIAGTITDTYFLLLRDAAGNETRVDFSRMEYADGSGAVFPVSGGDYTTSDGITINIQPDTFTTATPVRVRSVTPAANELPATPQDFQTLSYFTLDLNGAIAQKEINLSFPAPANVTDQHMVLVAKPVEFFGNRKWMPMEILKLEDGKLTTQSPPWPGVRAGAEENRDAYMLILAEGARFFFLQGSVGHVPALLEWDNLEMVVVLRDVYDWIVPLPVNQNYTMTVSDLNTAAIIFQGQPVPPATDGQTTKHLQKAISDDTIPPYVIGGSPLTFASWRVGSAEGDVRTNISFNATDQAGDGVADSSGLITIVGEVDALPEKAYAAIRNNKTGDVHGKVVALDGSFNVSVPYQFGDPVTVLLSSQDVEPGSAIRLRFSEPLADVPYAQLLKFYETENPTAKVNFNGILLNADQILEIQPVTNLKSDTDYTVVLEGIQDRAGNTMQKQFGIRFRTGAYDIRAGSGEGTVNDTILVSNHLIVGKDDGIEIYSTANPYDMQLVSRLPLPGGVRSFARNGRYVMAVGGGVQPNFGMLRQLDLHDFDNPRVDATLILSRFVGDTGDDIVGETNPLLEGRPIKILVENNYAYIANVGIGLQVVDLSRLAQPIYTFAHRTYAEPNLKDIALYRKPFNEDPAFSNENVINVVLSGSAMHDDVDNSGVSFKTMNALKLLASPGCPGGTVAVENRCQLSVMDSTVIRGPANNVEVLQDYNIDIDQDGKTGAAEDGDGTTENPPDKISNIRNATHTLPRTYETYDLAFVASGSSGIYVVDITNIHEPFLLGTIRVGEGITVSDIKLDKKNLRLYVPVGADGIYIVDVKDPFLIQPEVSPQVIGKIQVPDTVTDGNVTIDEELNTVYVATRDEGLQSVLVGDLNIEIATDRDANGLYEHVGTIDSEGLIATKTVEVNGEAFIEIGKPFPAGVSLELLKDQPPTKYYVLAQLPSAAGVDGRQVKVKIRSTNFFDHPIKVGAGFPDPEFEIMLKYVKPVDKNNDGIISEADGSFRLFVSDPFYITAHPLLPAEDKIGNSKLLSAGDFIHVELDAEIQQALGFVTADLLRQSRSITRALRMDWVDSEKPEAGQSPVTGSGETAFPPYLNSGEWFYSAIDFGIKGRSLDFAFARKYESQALYDGPLGFGWDHAYFARLQELQSGDVLFYDGMGRKELFTFQPLSAEAYNSPPGLFLKLQKLNDGNFLITDGGGQNLLFNNYGQLAYIQDRNANKIEFLYNAAGQLSVVLDALGRPIYYEYNEAGKLVAVRDFDDRKWLFHYNENVASPDTKPIHLLTSVETPSPGDGEEPRITRFGYITPTADRSELPRVNIRSVTDPRGNEIVLNTYDPEDRLIKQRYGEAREGFNQELTFSFGDGATTVKDRRGKTNVYTMAAGVGTVSNNLQTSHRDALERNTTYESDEDGLVKSVVLPGNDQVNYKYADSTADSLAKGYLEQVTVIYKEEEGDQTTTVSKEFKNFGPFHLPQMTKDFGGHTTTVTKYEEKGGAPRNPESIQGPEGVTTNYKYDEFGQITRSIDGEGHEIVYEYYPEQTPHTIREANQLTGGYLEKTTDSEARAVDYVYDARGNVIETKDPNGVITKNTYNRLDELIETVRASGTSVEARTQTKYDKNGNVLETLVERESGKFSRTTFEYGVLDNVLNQTEYLNDEELVTSFQYDENQNPVLVTSPEGNQIKTEYDANNRKSATIRGFGSSDEARFSYEYDLTGNMIRMIDARANTTQYEYDAQNRVIRTTYPEGNEDRTSYDAEGKITQESIYKVDRSDPENVFANLLQKKSFTYDDLHRVERETLQITNGNPGALFTEVHTDYTYDRDNLVTMQTDSLNRATTVTYDGAHRKKSVLDPGGNKLEFTYDGNGNVKETREIHIPGAESHAQNTTYRISSDYDEQNRLIKTTDSAGHATHISYDLAGNVLTETDALGNTTSYEYDDLNRKVSKRISAGAGADITTKFVYDKNSRLKEFIDARFNRTSYEYDALNRISSVLYPSGQLESFEYDGNGNMISRIDRNNTSISLSYDKNNRLTDRNIVPQGNVSGSTHEHFEFDDLGRMVLASDEDSLVEMTYDSRGLMWRDRQRHGTTIRHFDEVGNNTKVIYPFAALELTRSYDSINQLNSISGNGIQFSRFAYLGPGRVTDRVAANNVLTTLNYDSDGRLSSLLHGPQGRIAGFNYQWNDAHFKTQESLQHWGGVTNTYGYDSAWRLTDSTIFHLQLQPDVKVLGYDGADNITSIFSSSGIQAFSYGQENRNLTNGDAQFNYDANGNITTHIKGNVKRRFTYDYANRLIAAQLYEGSNLKHTLSVEYDPLGRRTAKVLDGVRTEYVYDGNQVLQELDASANVKREFIWGMGIDELIAIRQGSNTYYAHQDQIGSVVAVTDQNGTFIERYNYDSFGKPYIIKEIPPPCVSVVTKQASVLTVDFCETVSTISATRENISILSGTNSLPFSFSTSGDLLTITLTEPLPMSQVRLRVFGVMGDGTAIPEVIERTFDSQTEGMLAAGGATFPVATIVPQSSIGNTYLFQGREWEPAFGIYYYRARYYDPSLGRFLQQDPQGYTDSPNLYQAFLNNPANYTDPMGTTTLKWFSYQGSNGGELPEPSAEDAGAYGMALAQQWQDFGEATFANPKIHQYDHYIAGALAIFGLAQGAPQLQAYLPSWRAYGSVYLSRLSNFFRPRPSAPPTMAPLQNQITVPPATSPQLSLPIPETGKNLPMLHQDTQLTRKYQESYDRAWLKVVDRFNKGRITIKPDQHWKTKLGQLVDKYARDDMRQYLEDNLIAEGSSADVLINRWLRDPSGSGNYRIPDIRLIQTRTILDGTIGNKDITSQQIQDFINFSRGYRVVIVRPQVGPGRH